MTTDILNVMIVDDTEAVRDLLVEIVNGIEGVNVVATAQNGRVALAKLKQLSVDLVLLDIEMPLMDGLEALEKIRESYPDIGIVMASAFHYDGADKVIKALEMGALDFVSKLGMDESGSWVLGIRRRLVTLIGLYRARRNARLARKLREGLASGIDSLVLAKETGSVLQKPAQSALLLARPFQGKTRVEVVVIGVSTGGPNALREVIPKLPGDLGVPVLLVQHMPATLTASLAESLNKKSLLHVREAIDGEEILPNTVYLAPGGKHLLVFQKKRAAFPSGPASKYIRLSVDSPVNSCRPSVDVLFRSVSEVYTESSVLALIMTGMGSDGMEGVRALKHHSCHCLIQSEETCVVYGMPRAVDEAGLSDEKVPLENIAERITDLVKSYRG